MNILHYSLGFPPYRTGGLVKYCMDLMLTQRERGDKVAMLWPGRIKLIKGKIKIKKFVRIDGIISFELVNPLPVALDEGIKDIDSYMNKGNKEFYKKILNSFKPDIIHIHTFMGIHKEFLMAAKELKIKTVFTTHDYYGLCPKVTLFCDGHTCDDDNDCRNCVACNETALSMRKIMLMQSPLYRKFKNSFILKELRNQHRKKFFDRQLKEISEVTELTLNDKESKANEYRKLREYYVSMYELIDTIHFNSTITEKIYKRYFEPKHYRVKSISHKSIADHRKKKEFNDKKLRITYLAPAKPFKGFKILKEALDELWNEGNMNFELNIYSSTNQVSPYMNINDCYKYDELGKIFDRTDLLVAPSVWYETFGFTILEALSYGVPVLVSENVGAKDLLEDNKLGVVIKLNKDNLKNAVLFLMNRDELRRINDEICNMESIAGANNSYLY